jgi:hypothetical protein
MCLKPTKRRGLVTRFISVLLRPQTIRLAVLVLRFVDLIARIIDRVN